MKPEQWAQAKQIFQTAIELAPAMRPQFLREACASDHSLRVEIEKLLASNAKAESFMEQGAEVAETVIELGNLHAGDLLNHYEIIKQIGVGGMGEVYLAQDKKLNRKVAIKILSEKLSRRESNLQRFIREAKAASALNHPNILVIHEIGKFAETDYIVSEFIEGKTLRQLLKEKLLPLPEVLEIAIQIAGALIAAHTARIVHRDIKPENIILRPDGYVKILDFGLAKLIEPKIVNFEDSTVKQSNTAHGVILGTVNYMSPEQAKGESVDERTDIFSCGVLLYEMIAGKTPFAGDSIPETFANLINKQPLPLVRYATNAPEELQRIVSKTLRKNKDERYQTMKGFLGDLKVLKENLTLDERLERSHPPETENATAAFLRQTTDNANQQTFETRGGFSQRITNHQTLIALALLALLLLVGVIGFGYYFRQPRKIIATANGKKSIAVLPFQNASQDRDAEYLSDGITENVINNLSQLSGLKVMAKNSVFRFKANQNDLPKIASELGVQTLVTGDIQQVGNQLVINVHLIDPNDGSQIWGSQFVKSSSDVIATQTEIAQSVANNLRLNLTDADKEKLAKRPTENAEAYQLYLKGRYFGDRQNLEDLNKSVALYRQAIALDPNFALAYSDIGMRYMILGMYFLPPKELMPQARANAEKAIALDKNLSDPHLVLGVVALLYDWDWDKAQAELAVGSEVKPQSLEGFSCSAHILQATGRAKEGDEDLRQALKDDPLSIPLVTELGCNSYYARRYDESINQYREALNLEPHNFIALYGLARSLNQKREYQEAVGVMESAKTFMPALLPIAVAEEGYAYAQMNKREEAARLLKTFDDASKQVYVDPFFRAVIYLGLGDKKQTLAWLEKAYEAKSPLMPTILNDVKWDALRDDARFQIFLNRLAGSSKND